MPPITIFFQQAALHARTSFAPCVHDSRPKNPLAFFSFWFQPPLPGSRTMRRKTSASKRGFGVPLVSSCEFNDVCMHLALNVRALRTPTACQPLSHNAIIFAFADCRAVGSEIEILTRESDHRLARGLMLAVFRMRSAEAGHLCSSRGLK